MSKYFNKEEFACHCGCGFDDVDPKLMDMMDDIREMNGGPIIISSGCRCENWNRLQGGEPNSQHMYGKAADFYSDDTDTKILAKYAVEAMADGVGTYPTWVHCDTRSGRIGDTYRW